MHLIDRASIFYIENVGIRFSQKLHKSAEENSSFQSSSFDSEKYFRKGSPLPADGKANKISTYEAYEESRRDEKSKSPMMRT